MEKNVWINTPELPVAKKRLSLVKKWAREELEQVYYIYAQCREQLHERNPVIQALARKIEAEALDLLKRSCLCFVLWKRLTKGRLQSQSDEQVVREEIWKENKWEMMIAEEPTRAS